MASKPSELVSEVFVVITQGRQDSSISELPNLKYTILKVHYIQTMLDTYTILKVHHTQVFFALTHQRDISGCQRDTFRSDSHQREVTGCHRDILLL